MRIKSYFGKTVEEGIAQARAELGAEALLLNTRKTGGQAGLPCGYEVVFGSAEEPAESARPAVAEPVEAWPKEVRNKEVREFRPVQVNPQKVNSQKIHPEKINPVAPDRSESFASELDRLHEQMDEIRNLLVRSASARLAIGRSVPELAEVHSRLMAADVEPALAKDIVDRLEASMATDAFFFKATESQEPVANRWKSLKFDAQRLKAFVRAEMGKRVQLDAELKGDVMAVVGPTGAGKTTSLMKIASTEAVNRRVRILTLDTSRAAALIQLQSFAGRIGAGFAALQSTEALAETVAEARKKELVMIDTPGFAGNGGPEAESAALAFAACNDVDVHLVVPGYMKASDLRRSIHRYGIFRPAKLLVTKLDETQTFGSVFSEAARARLPLSFLTDGPSVPGDIRAASLEDLVAMAFESQQARAECA